MMQISIRYTFIAILAVLCCTPVFSQTDSLALSSAVVPPGGTATLSLSLSAPGSQVAGLQWTIVYPPSTVVAITASAGSAATSALKSLECAGSPGTYSCFLTGLNASGLNENLIPNGIVASVSVTISSTAASVPLGITNAMGATQSGGAVAITGTGGTITALPLGVSAVTCNPATLASGASTICTVSLSQAPAGGALVTLADNNSLLTIPASVTVAAGRSSAAFTATAGTFTTGQSVTITAALNGTTQAATLTLVAPTLVSALACNPASVNSGASSTCTVSLSQAAGAGGNSVALSSNNAALSVPAFVTVSAGSTAASFTASTGSVTATQSGSITAALNGSAQTATLTIVAQQTVSALACTATALDAGAATNCTVTLSSPAPTGGTAVSLSSNNPALTVPASVDVAAASSTATFVATAATEPPNGGSTETVSVTATLDGVSRNVAFTLTLCPCSLWPSTAQPLNPASNNKQAIEVGMQFTSGVAGYVTGIRFYKSATNKGMHLGNLWTATGTHLAEVQFTNETASGWQIAYFSSPVAITANTTYVISYHAPQGNTAADNGAFTTAVSNLPLEALADGQNGPNGRYLLGASGFPTTEASATNYWVDVIFNTSPTVGTTAPVSVWAPTAVPNNPGISSGQPAQLGLRFQSEVPGYITGVRFYKGTKNLGTHTAYLWNASGTQLAAVQFANESASGWQQANFATPVAIAAYTTYVISYLSTKGHYADDAGYFATTGVTNQMLYAPPDGQYGPNGAYASSNTFPAASSGNSSNYWVDLVFTTAIQ